MIATNETQSRKLLNAGIDPRTADMFWDHGTISCYVGFEWLREQPHPILTMNREDVFDQPDYFVPAWSLSALIQLLPEHVFYRIARAHGHDVEKIFEDCVEYLCLKSDDSRKLWSATH